MTTLTLTEAVDWIARCQLSPVNLAGTLIARVETLAMQPKTYRFPYFGCGLGQARSWYQDLTPGFDPGQRGSVTVCRRRGA